MKKDWTTTKLMATCSLGVLSLVLSLTGAPITSISGIPGGSGIINALHGASLTVLTAFIIQSFGAITIFSLVYSILSIPLPLLGVSGFLPKIFIGLFSGITSDITYQLLKKNDHVASIVVGFVSQLSIGMGIYVLGKMFGIPGIGKLENIYLSQSTLVFVILFFVMFIILGLFGLFGLFIYKKIENTSTVKRIRR